MERDADVETVGLEQLRAIVAARELIEQVKGAIMLGFGVDAAQAFVILRAASQDANIKIRDMAESVAAILPEVGTRAAPTALRESLEAILFGPSSIEHAGLSPHPDPDDDVAE
ncbi:ANTAR domain-containing protein [Nocardia takedensis]